MTEDQARAIARAMNRAGFHAAAENFVNERAAHYNDYQANRLVKVWLS